METSGAGSRYSSFSPSLSARAEEPEYDPLGVAVMSSPAPSTNNKGFLSTGKVHSSGSLKLDTDSKPRGRYDGVVPGYVTSVVPAHRDDLGASEATMPIPERRPTYNANANPNPQRSSLSSFSDPLSYLSEPISYLTSAFNQVTQSQSQSQSQSNGSHGTLSNSFYPPTNSATTNRMNNQIGSRLLEVADMLLLMQLQSMEDLNATSSSPNSNPGSTPTHPTTNLNISAYLQGTQQRIFEQDVRREAVRRLRMLSDVLLGSLSVDEYDARCGLSRDDRRPT